MNKLEITYPCEWQYTVIGVDEAVLREAISEVFLGKEYSVEYSKKSKEGKYVSLIVKVKVVSEDERTTQFALLGNHPAIKIVI